MSWAPHKHPARLRATYHRTDAIRYFHGCCSIGDDQLWGVVREHKGAGRTLAALKSIRAARPGGYPLFVIIDNLSANKTPAIRRWAQRENVELCSTRTNASWANPIEAQFGPTFTMGGSDHPSHTVLARKLQAYLRWRNAHARHPDVLPAQRRERARVRSERQQRWGLAKSRMTHPVNVHGQRTSACPANLPFWVRVNGQLVGRSRAIRVAVCTQDYPELVCHHAAGFRATSSLGPVGPLQVIGPQPHRTEHIE